MAYRLGKDQATVYALEGSIAMAGALVQWLRDNLQVIKNSSEAETLATAVQDNGYVYICSHFYWCSHFQYHVMYDCVVAKQWGVFCSR